MTRKTLLDEIRGNPGRFYRAPGDVLRDRRFADEERLVILDAWRGLAPGAAVELDAAIAALKSRRTAS